MLIEAPAIANSNLLYRDYKISPSIELNDFNYNSFTTIKDLEQMQKFNSYFVDIFADPSKKSINDAEIEEKFDK
jgi:hypothetical protein